MKKGINKIKCTFCKIFIICLIFNICCCIKKIDYLSKNVCSINFDEVTIWNGKEKKFNNRMSLLISKDTIKSCLHYNDNINIQLSDYRIYLEGRAIYIETSTKGKLLFFSLIEKDTIPLLDLWSLSSDYPSFYGKNIYEKDSIIEILGQKRECYVFKQLTGRYVDSTYSTKRQILIDKQRFFLLKEEDVSFDIFDHGKVRSKRNLEICKIY